MTCGQSYKASTIVIYDSRVVPDLKTLHITTLGSSITIVTRLAASRTDKVIGQIMTLNIKIQKGHSTIVESCHVLIKKLPIVQL